MDEIKELKGLNARLNLKYQMALVEIEVMKRDQQFIVDTLPRWNTKLLEIREIQQAYQNHIADLYAICESEGIL